MNLLKFNPKLDLNQTFPCGVHECPGKVRRLRGALCCGVSRKVEAETDGTKTSPSWSRQQTVSAQYTHPDARANQETRDGPSTPQGKPRGAAQQPWVPGVLGVLEEREKWLLHKGSKVKKSSGV